MVLKTYAPASGEPLAELPVSSQNEVEATVKRARRAHEAWSVVPVAERCQRLLRLRDALVENAGELVEVITRECGKPRHEALIHEVAVVASLIDYYAKNAPQILAPREIPLHLAKHRRSYVGYAARGVIGVISPWNYPFALAMSEVVAALCTGSAAVVKPSEVTPLTMLKAKEVFDSTGLPRDLMGIVTGYGDTGQQLIEAGIDKLYFTGGVETGKRVAAACGARLIPVVMELGGKAPLIACADADVERTARAITFGGFANAGQICISVERVYAHRDVYGPLLSRVEELSRNLKVGDPSKDFVDVGAIIHPRQIAVAEAHLKDALAKGARLVLGGARREGPGQYFDPTILAECNHTMTVMTEEIFGPIVPFQCVANDDEAIGLANASPLGLNAYVFTRDATKGRALAERVRAGSVMVNDVLANYGMVETPFGGVKQSGFGRVHGEDALRDMAEARHINHDRFTRFTAKSDPFWFPYTAGGFHWMQRGVKLLYSGQGIVQRLRRW